MGAFQDSINKQIAQIKQEINDRTYAIAYDLFVKVISNTPVLTGCLINNWFPSTNSYSGESTSSTDKSGSQSISRLSGLNQNAFVNSDGFVSLTNSLPYAYRAEYLGWEAPEWSGKIGPYAMVRNAVTEIAGRILMSIRSELETKLINWANTQVPPIPIAIEGIPFVKPTSGYWIQAYLLASSTTNPTVDGLRTRVKGVFQVNLNGRDGVGSGAIESLSQEIVSLFPLVPKTGTVSIERTPNTGMAIATQDGWRTIPISISYRQEGYA